jgi:tripeptidyl-peptidase-1
MIVNLLHVLAVAAVVHGHPKSATNLVLHDRRDSVPGGFKLANAVDTGARLKFSIAVAQSNMTGLKAVLDEISDYNHPNYGQWLTKDQVGY